jgi:hypothetical protein
MQRIKDAKRAYEVSDLLRILRNVRGVVLDKADRLPLERTESYREIHHLQRDRWHPQDITDALIKVLEIYSNNLKELKQKVGRLEQDSECIQKQQDEIERLVQNVTLLEDEKRRIEKRQQELELMHKNKMLELTDNHEKRVKGIRRAYELEKMAQKTTYDAEKRMLQGKHDANWSRLQTECAETERLGSVINVLDAEKSGLQAKISEMQQNHALTIKQMEQEHESEKNLMQKEHETELEVQKTQLEMAHAEEKERLRKDVDAYSAALLARDDFKPTPDNEIKARFQDLVQDVDALARLEWKVNQEWTSQALRRLLPKQRLLKKQILQNSMWTILHRYIFCSPFRIFGEEGQSLEMLWNEECGKGLAA